MKLNYTVLLADFWIEGNQADSSGLHAFGQILNGILPIHVTDLAWFWSIVS